MLLCGTYNVERVVVHPDNTPHTTHYIDITTDKDAPKFFVTSCCDDEWIWEFWYSKTNYEIVKYLIMDCVMCSESMEELIYALDETFEENCYEILWDEAETQDDEMQCDGDCANCEYEI